MYVKIEDGIITHYPYTIAQLKQEYHFISFPEQLTLAVLSEFGVFEVLPTVRPSYNSITHQLVELDPTLVEGTYQQQWSVVELSAEAAESNRLASQIELVNQIKQIRDTKTQTGGFPAAGKWFHSDTFSRTQHLGFVMMGSNIPAGIMWKTMDGTFIEMTPTIAGQVFAAAAAQDAALFAYAETLISQVNAAADPSTVDINSGWPTTYNG